jgi:hypothetical protein
VGRRQMLPRGLHQPCRRSSDLSPGTLPRAKICLLEMTISGHQACAYTDLMAPLAHESIERQPGRLDEPGTFFRGLFVRLSGLTRDNCGPSPQLSARSLAGSDSGSTRGAVLAALVPRGRQPDAHHGRGAVGRRAQFPGARPPRRHRRGGKRSHVVRLTLGAAREDVDGAGDAEPPVQRRMTEGPPLVAGPARSARPCRRAVLLPAVRRQRNWPARVCEAGRRLTRTRAGLMMWTAAPGGHRE